ncbi:MAG TPA: UDP-N-acetylmuramoyl-L-alanine--D-glutamate ligase [Myxococcaceae bacterium]|jgi:UDP-N-acetylmuramoylalanine--D-glutamate ligase
MFPSLKGARAVVVGVGKSGLSAARLLRREGALVTAVDKKPAPELGAAAAELSAMGAELRSGEVPDGAQLVVVSPGVPLNQPGLQRARAAGVPVVGEVELAWRFLSPKRPFIGITGTNGKSTTTALCGELFTRAGLRPFVGGNLGRPLCESPLSGARWGAHVVELSSFQLEGIEELRCSAAVVTNVTPDHLDRYPTPADYVEAKRRIFMNQAGGDVAVVNADDPAAATLAPTNHGYGFTLREEPGPRFKRGAVAAPGGFRIIGGSAFQVRNPALRGAHNLQNAMAAALLASLSGVGDRAIQEGLDSYPGLPHRMEVARTLDGVEWINDSKATNVDSSVVALRAFPGGVWLIAGGLGKGAPYAPMVELSRGKVRAVLTIGQDAPAIEAAYRGQVDVVPCGTLENAVAEARRRAGRGDVVLLSPACASYDQFKNFEDRGDTFKRLVGALT